MRSGTTTRAFALRLGSVALKGLNKYIGVRCTVFPVKLLRILLILSIFKHINTDNSSHIYKANRNCP